MTEKEVVMKVKCDVYYRVTDDKGKIRLETLRVEEAQDYLKRKFEDSNELMNIEAVARLSV